MPLNRRFSCVMIVLIAEFFQGRREVTDIGTGETVIGDLATALWLE